MLSLWLKQTHDLEDITHLGKSPLNDRRVSSSPTTMARASPGARKMLRPQFATPVNVGSKEGGSELPMTTSAHRWQVVWLHARTQHYRRHIHFSLYASCKKGFMSSTRHCTWPLLSWKKHLVMYPDVSSRGLFANLASRSSWCGSYRTRIKMPEAEWVLVATWVKISVWKWVFTSLRSPARTRESQGHQHKPHFLWLLFWTRFHHEMPCCLGQIQRAPAHTHLTVISDHIQRKSLQVVRRERNARCKRNLGPNFIWSVSPATQ